MKYDDVVDLEQYALKHELLCVVVCLRQIMGLEELGDSTL